ncbi:MAG: hypothetical protein MUF38_03450 [Anaerolineae bacterium]|nr:hypothetical protein [Anaerolineae bacterium]
MQPPQNDYIAPYEWRWVLLLGSLMLLVALAPFAVMDMARPTTDLAFGGLVHDIADAGAAVAAMRQSLDPSAGLPPSLYTPEPLPGLLTELIYVVLGRFSALAGLDVLAVFHVARLLAGLLMVHTVYLLAASIWQRVALRRMFSAIALLGGGVGWLLAPTIPTTLLLDVSLSPAYPFHTLLMNVHYPLAVACLSLLAAAGITALRPGSTEMPSVTNYGLRLLLFSMVLVLIDPPALFPFALAFVVVVGFHGIAHPHLLRRDMLMLLWFGVPALPLVGYLLAVAMQQPLTFGLWITDSGLPLPSAIGFILSLGVPLVLALPALWKVLRRLEPNDSALMLFWLVLMVVLGYRFTVLGGALWVGMMLPVAYFATRGVQEFWLRWMPRPALRLRLGLVLLPLLALSHFVALIAPFNDHQKHYLSAGYPEALVWLERFGSPQTVVLASPEVSLWVPVWSARRVVYATANKALNPVEKVGVVRSFYRATDSALCEAILDGEFNAGLAYRIQFVIVGPLEEAMGGGGACLDGLALAFQSGDVRVYRHR